MFRLIRGRQSLFTALGLALALAAWMLSGQGDPPVETAATVAAPPLADAIGVRVREHRSRPFTRTIEVSAQTEPARIVTLRGEVEGRVVERPAQAGDRVVSGAVIARLDSRDREAQLAEAQAVARQRELEYEAARRLGRQGLQAETEIARARAALEAAVAGRERIEVEIAHTTIEAPFSGVVEDGLAEVGDFIGVGDPVATVIDLDPIVITAQVSQQQLGDLSVGRPATATLLSGQTVTGAIRYIGARSSDATRTFRIEVAVANPDHAIAAGLTARLSFPVATVQAHFLSPELLSLDDNGELGIKTVGSDDRVEFHPVTIVQAEPDGVWLTGLPADARIITVGQGFVHAGQQVRPIPDDGVVASPGNGRDRS